MAPSLIPFRISASNLTEPRCEEPFTRHVIGFDTNPIGILKKHGIVARCKTVFLGRMDNVRTRVDGKYMDLIDIPSAARTKTEMM